MVVLLAALLLVVAFITQKNQTVSFASCADYNSSIEQDFQVTLDGALAFPGVLHLSQGDCLFPFILNASPSDSADITQIAPSEKVNGVKKIKISVNKPLKGDASLRRHSKPKSH